MSADELRDRLAGIDPARDVATEEPTTPSARSRLERIMHTDTDTTTTTTGTSTRFGGRLRLAAAAAAALVVVAVGAVALAGGGGGNDEPVASGAPVELSLGASDSMMSCMPVDAAILADMPLAFAGTATSVEGETVTLEVDEWFTGGDAATVVLRAQSGTEALIDGFAFEEGAEYLVSATEGTVNFCGYSGPATGELRAVYDAAFGS